MPEEVITEVTMHKFSWDYFGEYYSPLTGQKELGKGFQNNFFYFRIDKDDIE
jgi:hypothetical protein